MARIPAKRLELLSIQAVWAHRELVRSVNSSLAPGGGCSGLSAQLSR